MTTDWATKAAKEISNAINSGEVSSTDGILEIIQRNSPDATKIAALSAACQPFIEHLEWNYPLELNYSRKSHKDDEIVYQDNDSMRMITVGHLRELAKVVAALKDE